jgi:hypothetical protein
MANRAWGALGAVWVLVIAAGGTGGCERARGGEAQATAAVGGADDDESGLDESGLDSADEPALTPDVEAPDIQSAPDDVGDDATQGAGDDSGSSSGSSSSSGGVPVDDSGPPVMVADSGGGAPPGGGVDASVESGGVTIDAGAEAAGLADTGTAPETGATRPLRGGNHVTEGSSGGSIPVGPAIGGAPSYGDDASTVDIDAGSTFGGSWDGDGAAPPALEMSPSRAVLGCAGCSVPDAGAPGALAWLLVALTVGARALRRRTR